ncbi:MAG TPA: hypothetical protein VFH78_06930 [Candidatus Thermoplasmatota archaeon]|nr:hypothetical protein [Candidatus Thermoplasmatota archaeon]
MPGEKNPFHVKQGSGRDSGDVDTRDLEARNEGTWRGPGEEPRNAHEAGDGTLGKSLGGAHTGRYAGAPSKVMSNRERKPRGNDKE